MIDAQIPADADQPGLEVGAAIEGVERLEDLEEDVLGQVFGLVVLADELVRDVEYLAPMQPDDALPGGLVSAQAALDQRFEFRPAALEDRQTWVTGERSRDDIRWYSR